MDIRHLMKLHAECCRRRKFKRYVRRKLRKVRIRPAGELSAPGKERLIEESILFPVFSRKQSTPDENEDPVCE